MAGAQFVDDALRAAKGAIKKADVARPVAQPRVLSGAMPQQIDEVAEAGRLLNADIQQFKQTDTHQVNFDLISTTDDIKATIGQVADANKGVIDEARRNTITNEQLAGLANDLNIRVDVVEQVMTREAGDVLNAETILAARQVLNNSGERLRTLAQKVKAAEATDMDKLAFRRQFQWHGEYQRQFMGARAEAGRALGAFNIPVGTSDLEVARLNELVDTVQGGDIMDMAELVIHADSLQGINKATREYGQSKVMGVVQELFINSILSGPKTHVVNTAGNGLFNAMNVAETAVAARIGRFLPGDDHVMIGEASAMVYGEISALRTPCGYSGARFVMAVQRMPWRSSRHRYAARSQRRTSAWSRLALRRR